MAVTKIIFLILPEVHLLDLAGPDQVFLEAKDYGANLDICYCSIQAQVATSTHLPMGPLQHFSEIKPQKGDYIFIPGANVSYLLSPASPPETALIQWLRTAQQQQATLCSVCTGAFFLARCGLLNGVKCTTHWKRTRELKLRFPQIQVTENVLFTEDKNIFTSAGVTAGIDMALHILSKIKDDHCAFLVARELVVYARRQGHEAQQSIYLSYRNHIHSGIHAVQDFLQEHLDAKQSLDALAEIAYMSVRNLTRIFKKETGISIKEYVTLLRKERLKHLLKNPDITRSQLAHFTGLESERQVIRLIKTLSI